MKDLLFIDKMLTTRIITIVYWLMLLFAVLTGISAIRILDGFIGLLTGLVIMALSACLARIFCECFAVIFKCYEELKEINSNQAPSK